ncbi:hypothetical protein ACFQH6_03555 [Halobacteriaceae archaeon GCM10025711]
MPGDDSNDPLEGLYVDGDEFDRERLFNALQGIIGIDRETGNPVFQSGYTELDGRGKFTAQLLYRVAADALDELEDEDLGAPASKFSDPAGVSDRSINNYGEELKFVHHDEEKGGYYIPAFAIEEAIEYLAESD